MSTEPIPLSEIIAEMSEEDQAWVAEESARLIAEEYARRAALNESEREESTPRSDQGAQSAAAPPPADAAD